MKKAIFKIALLSLALICTFGSPASAQQLEQNKQHQKQNNITVHTGAFYCITNSLYNGYWHDFFSLTGIRYERNLLPSVSVYLNYMFTSTILLNKDLRNMAMFYTPKGSADWWHRQHDIGDYYDPSGRLDKMVDCRFIDLGGSYIYDIHKRQRLSVSLGFSYAVGRNDYTTLIIWAPGPPVGMGDLSRYEYDTRWKGYLGGVIAVGYDYLLWKNRINVGVDASLRKYEGDFPLFTNYGFHAGFNF